MSYDDEEHPTQKDAPPVGVKQISWPVIRTQKDLSSTAEMHRSGGRVYALQGKKIGEILNSLGVIDDKTLLAVEQHHQNKKINGKPIGQLLLNMGIIEAEALARALCIQSGVPMVDVLFINIPYDILDRIPKDKAREKKVVPVGVYNKTLYLAVADPATFSEQHHFAFITKLNIKPVFSPLHEIETFINTKWTGSNSDLWAG
jgi:hypothetical protein